LLLGIASVCLSITSCSKTDPNRKVTVPVHGEVYVDGQPAAMVQVQCHPLEGMDKEQPTITQAITDDNGKFQLATYEAGDGAPLGEYKLTFVWQDFSVIAASFSGPDKLKGRYKDPKSSEVALTVEKGATDRPWPNRVVDEVARFVAPTPPFGSARVAPIAPAALFRRRGSPTPPGSPTEGLPATFSAKIGS
jgi:5-hydroxyisourate hydrolase-like protein (transthyretin family)